MDREILFKGKRIDNKEWVEGNFIRKNDPTKTDDVFWCCFIQDMALSMYEVMPKTVSQFTGFVDSKGNKVFDGDILVGDKYKGHVKYGAGCFFLYDKNDDNILLYKVIHEDKSIEIKVNIAG